jgi:hypothetical protein
MLFSFKIRIKFIFYILAILMKQNNNLKHDHEIMARS